MKWRSPEDATVERFAALHFVACASQLRSAWTSRGPVSGGKAFHKFIRGLREILELRTPLSSPAAVWSSAQSSAWSHGVSLPNRGRDHQRAGAYSAPRRHDRNCGGQLRTTRMG